MEMKEWARREIELACKRERGDKDPNEWDYGCACYESAYKAFNSTMALAMSLSDFSRKMKMVQALSRFRVKNMKNG